MHSPPGSRTRHLPRQGTWPLQADAPVIPSTTALIISALLQVAGETWAPARRPGTCERGSGKCEAAAHGTGQCTHIPPRLLFRATNVRDQQLWGTQWGREAAFPGLPNSCPRPRRRKVMPRGMTRSVIAGHGDGCGCTQSSGFPPHAIPRRGGHSWDSFAGSPLPATHPQVRRAPNISIATLSAHPCGDKHSAPDPAPVSGMWPEGPGPSLGASGLRGPPGLCPRLAFFPGSHDPLPAPGGIDSHQGDLRHPAGNVDRNH